MRNTIRYNSSRIGSGLTLLLFFILPCYAFSGNKNFFLRDSIKTKYALNDPRNPDCPCHKHQQLAEQEYKRLLMQGVASTEKIRGRHSQQRLRNFSGHRNEKPDEKAGRGFSNESEAHKKHNEAYVRHKRHRKDRRFNKWRRMHGIRNWEIWKRVCDPAACYKWS